MASMTRSESIAEPSSTPTLSAKTLPVNGASAPQASGQLPQKAGKPATSAPRIDIEPLYTALKAQIGEHWAAYKEALSLFVLGRLNQPELARRIDWFIATDASREHLHNQLVAAIYANTLRDPPEPGVASWVSANDKPSATSKPSSGDAAELRLKTEVKELQGRERKRLKAIADDPMDYFSKEMQEYHAAKQISLPDPGAASSSGFSKTNWDLEIRKRYAQPLCTETFEFPDTAAIEARMTPICYEEGIASGASPDAAAFMNIATETFIKEVLSNILGRVRSNGEDYIRTAAYKRQLQREEEMWLSGEVQRNPAGQLPVDIEESKNRKPLNLGDLRIALELGDSYLGQVPLIAANVMNARYYDDQSYEAEQMDLDMDLDFSASTASRLNGLKKSGINGVPPPPPPPPPATTNGVTNGTTTHHHNEDEMMLDENDWGWQGASTRDREAVNSVLDDILATGQ